MKYNTHTESHDGRRSLLGRRTLFAAGACGALASLPLLGAMPGSRAVADPARAGRLRYQGWPGTVLLPELAEALGYLGTIRLEWVGGTSSGPQDLQAAATGSTDFAGAFNGSVMRLIGAGAPVRAVIAYAGADPVSCCGLFVPDASPVRRVSDLAGRIVGVNTLRAQQQCFVEQAMLAAGLDDRAARQVTLVAVSPVIAEAALRHGRIDAAALSLFFRDDAMARGGLRELTNDHQLYGTANMDSIIMRDSYLERFPEQAGRFVAGVARAIAWAQDTPRAEVVALLCDIIRKRGRGESEIPVRHWRSSSIATRGGVMVPTDFVRFQSWYARRGDVHTATLPAGLIYTNRFNPYASI